MKQLLSVLILSLSWHSAAGQNMDTLLRVWHDPQVSDSLRMDAYYAYIWDGFLFTDPDSALTLAEGLHAFAAAENYPLAASIGFHVQGVASYVKSDYERGMDYHGKSLAINERLGNLAGIAKNLANMANIRKDQSRYAEALELLERAMAMQERMGNKQGMGSALSTIGGVQSKQGKPHLALGTYRRSLALFEEIQDLRGMASLQSNIGGLYYDQGDQLRALEYCERAERSFQKIGDKNGEAITLTTIGNIHRRQKNFADALRYQERCMKLYTELGNERAIGISHMSFGTIHSEQGNGARALEEYDRARLIFERIGAKSALAVLYGSIADVYAGRNEYEDALALYERSLHLRQELGERGFTAQLNNIGMLHLKMGNAAKALAYCDQGLVIAKELEELNGQYAACQCLYDAYKSTGHFADALAQLEQLNVITDSLKAQETGKKLLQMEFTKVLVADSLLQDQEKRTVAEAHAEEVRQKNRTRNLLLGSSLGILVLAGGVYSRLRLVRRSKAALQVEKDRSEALLLNILPHEVAEELKAKGETEAVHIDQVTVLFTDFKGFTAMSEVLSPRDLVRDLNECFSAFDHITSKYGIEKIKTIGDAYMAAGGLPTPNTTHATDVIKAALEMRDFIAEGKARKVAAGLPYFEIRIGIHTGPVVAGIVGVKKFQYDIWGDTVNTASRMESSGEVGQVNISEATYALVKLHSPASAGDVKKANGEWSIANVGSTHSPTPIHHSPSPPQGTSHSPFTNSHSPAFVFTPRGKVQAKGKGEMEMYFVENG